MTTISLSFTPEQLDVLHEIVSNAPSTVDGRELLARIDSAIDARTFWDALTDEQRTEAKETCAECIRDDIDDIAEHELLTDPDIDEMTNYTTPEED